MIKIKKNSGVLVEFDMSKIKDRIHLACEGLNVDQMLLESNLGLHIRDGITSAEIQKTLMATALQLGDLTHDGGYDFTRLDWRFVAARFLLQDIFKRVGRNRMQSFDDFGYSAKSFYKSIKKGVSNGIYDKRIIREYTKDEIEELGKVIELEGVALDSKLDYASVNLMDKRYLVKMNSKSYELPQEMFGIVSLLLASTEKKEDRMEWAKKFYKVLSQRKISLATPLLSNLRKPNGNLSSCFIVAMDDSLDSIDWTEDMLAQISKHGGGVGVNVSRIRCAGSWMQGHKGISNGILPWIRKINDIAVSVSQAANKRSGAITVGLDIWHYDIESFLEMQEETGDTRQKSFDVFPQVIVSDLFMERKAKGENWTLFDPYEIRTKFGVELCELYGKEFEAFYKKIEADETIELKQVVSARDLFKKVLKIVVESGLPYVIFKDTINEANPNKHAGYIGQANLCVESFGNFYPSKNIGKSIHGTKISWEVTAGRAHVCNLVSLVLSNIANEEEARDLSYIGARMLDNAIDLTRTPVPEADLHNIDYRLLGIGSMGLADWLAERGLPYGSKKALDSVNHLYENIAYGAIKSSVDMAEIRGTYKLYPGSEFSKGIFFNRTEAKIIKESTIDSNLWVSLFEKQRTFGMRNGSLLAIAPNTSTSNLMGASPSFLPVFSKFYIDSSSAGNVPIVAPKFSQKTMFSYIEMKNIDQLKVIGTASKLQYWNDQGISLECLLNLNREGGYSAKQINELYDYAWKSKCKTVYYVRSVSKKANSEEACESCAS